MVNHRIWQSIGRETILECTITALPQAITFWQKDGRRITNMPRPSLSAADAAGDNDDDRGDGDGLGASGVPKYRIEAYDEGHHTLTLNLRLQVSNVL